KIIFSRATGRAHPFWYRGARRSRRITRSAKRGGMQLTKAKREPALAKPAPQLARAELLDKGTRARFESEIEAALKRKPAAESKLGGALRAVAPMSPALRATMADATRTMIKRRTIARELYSASLRALAELDERQALPLVKQALALEDAG